MTESQPVVFYCYDESPFAAKVANLLLLKNLPHKRVKVPRAPPRPELSQLLGVTYRRIPVLAIGRDLYCDSASIADAIERRFPPSTGYITLFPTRAGGGKADTGLVKAFVKFYSDTILFGLAVIFLPWDKFPQAFLDDRSKLLGAPIKPAEMEERRPAALSTLLSHQALVEEQLQDGRNWLFDTKEPGLGDVSVHFILNWIRGFGTARPLFDTAAFPHTLSWLQRMDGFLKVRKTRGFAKFDNITGEAAANAISVLPEDTLEATTFDPEEGKRLGLVKDAAVAVVAIGGPGEVPTVGTLVGLTKQEFVIQTHGTVASVNCHFPRLGYRAYGHQGAAKL
ncbi:hypothetical protein BDV98DRAFT_561091 [Pterulicium gracile]|uniref:GST N-terminal domain-containing protein n=1 Tax=Pterulicium gracile TaxID=1884261 RepID=A0A5C3QVR6_9AGAR|nr:hypothetical protein BDV98DRAFT_561091 [Pterula gracilis]